MLRVSLLSAPATTTKTNGWTHIRSYLGPSTRHIPSLGSCCIWHHHHHRRGEVLAEALIWQVVLHSRRRKNCLDHRKDLAARRICTRSDHLSIISNRILRVFTHAGRSE